MLTTEEYAKRTSALMGVDLPSDIWDLIPDNRRETASDSIKRQVNALLITQASKSTDISEDLQKKCAALDLNKGMGGENFLDQQRANLREHVNSYRNYFSSARQSLDRVKSMTQDLDRLLGKKGSRTTLECVQAILKNPFYTLREIQGSSGRIEFITGECNVAHPMDASSVYPLGRFIIHYIPNSTAPNAIIASKYQGNNFYPQRSTGSGQMHPFFQGTVNSSICFGDATEAVAMALFEDKVEIAFGILQSLLTTYNKYANPYVALESFSKTRAHMCARCNDRILVCRGCVTCGGLHSACKCTPCETRGCVSGTITVDGVELKTCLYHTPLASRPVAEEDPFKDDPDGILEEENDERDEEDDERDEEDEEERE